MFENKSRLWVYCKVTCILAIAKVSGCLYLRISDWNDKQARTGNTRFISNISILNILLEFLFKDITTINLLMVRCTQYNISLCDKVCQWLAVGQWFSQFFLLHNCHGKIKQQNSINQQRAWTTPIIKKSCSLERLGNSHLTFCIYILNGLLMGSLSYWAKNQLRDVGRADMCKT